MRPAAIGAGGSWDPTHNCHRIHAKSKLILKNNKNQNLVPKLQTCGFGEINENASIPLNLAQNPYFWSKSGKCAPSAHF